MSERIDRGIGGNRWLLWLLVAVLAAAAGVYAWQRLRVPPATKTVPAPTTQSARPDEPLPVTLYRPADGLLAAVPASVVRQPSTQAQAHAVLAALFADPIAAQSAVLNEVKPRAFFLDASGIAYVDLSPVRPEGPNASAWDELLAIYAVADTLMQNFEEIKQVRFLIEGRETQTLAGHIDLSAAFEKRMDLVKQ